MGSLIPIDDELETSEVLDQDGNIIEDDEEATPPSTPVAQPISQDPFDALEYKIERLMGLVKDNSSQTSVYKNEIVSLNAQNDLLKKQIEKLEKELLKKENRIQEMLDKLDPLFGN